MSKQDRLIQYSSDRFVSEPKSDISMLSDVDKEVLHKAMNKEWTNPKYKLRYFVGEAQITPYAKMRQWLLEIKSKEESIENLEYEIAKAQVEYDRFERMRDQAHDDLDKRLAEIEMWNSDRIMYTTKRRLQDWYLERQQLIDLLTEFLASDQAYLPDGSGRTYMDILNTEEEDLYEAEYWTNRLAKQAATDMLFYGRIGSGNMDAILQMPPEQQAETLSLTVNYSTKLQDYQNRLQSEAEENLKLNYQQEMKSLTTPADENDVETHSLVDDTEKKDEGLIDDVYST